MNLKEMQSAMDMILEGHWPDVSRLSDCGEIGRSYRGGFRKPRNGRLLSARGFEVGACPSSSTTRGTIFEDTISNCIFAYAFHLLCPSKNGMSAHSFTECLA